MNNWLAQNVAERNYFRHVDKCPDCESGLVVGGCKEERRLHAIVWKEINA